MTEEALLADHETWRGEAELQQHYPGYVPTWERGMDEDVAFPTKHSWVIQDGEILFFLGNPRYGIKPKFRMTVGPFVLLPTERALRETCIALDRDFADDRGEGRKEMAAQGGPYR